ncbi:cyclin CLN3 KNAG_0E00320 [Huiozyma naganishii CBS 8797]|uniref:Cyclin-like domain-containing protein n=1 Tax=Huiozyma naganishii (strain ATCC MYA-139 / BCRC 22969 / CBS 8797 / KCTC 17520 / NBRC 10181 / NCYC 3082 / Yp74L-3) TaxID=1071383 RepID=J7R614_HUIN7|nr:hypothetical protein KNAG_0E00320 [Kazachstania naganishii CBS 8797]CCK70300.1 hypothetical protein KNAG_0E00320 [Kazachstania naganishii CBS 8797]
MNNKIRPSHLNLLQSELKNHQLTVREYLPDFVDMWKVSLNQQSQHTIFNYSNFTSQPYINSQMRSVIFEFVLLCHSRLRLSTTTLFQTLNVIDNFTSVYQIKNYNYQLLAVTAFWSCSKMYDVKRRIPQLQTLAELCCNQYSKKQFLTMELTILQNVGWCISKIPTFDTFIDLQLLKQQQSVYGQQQTNVNDSKLLCIMICELVCFAPHLHFQYSHDDIVQCCVDIITNGNNNLEKNTTTGPTTTPSATTPATPTQTPLHHKLVNYLVSLNNEKYPTSFKLKYQERYHSVYRSLTKLINRLTHEAAMNTFIAHVVDTPKPFPHAKQQQQHHQAYKLPLTPTTPSELKRKRLNQISEEDHPSPVPKMRKE